MRSIALTALLLGFGTPAAAQDFGLTDPAPIETQDLDAALDFDPGTLLDTALDTALWQGTSAARAAELLRASPTGSTDPLVRNMLRTVVLSGGVPPRAETQADAQIYERARLQAVLALGDRPVIEAFLARNPDLAKAPLAQVDLALALGDGARACELSDTVTTERGRTAWVRLRAVCHALRGERAAAELTRDLLRGSGYDDDAYFTQLDALIAERTPPVTRSNDGLVRFMAERKASESEPTKAGLDADLTALFAQFETLDLAALQSGFGNLSFDPQAPDLDRETALASPAPRATARLFVLGQMGEASALDAFINRAVRAGMDEPVVLAKLAPMIAALPAQARAETNLARYAGAAVVAGDLGSLQALYSALPDGPARGRIALAADAIGGGFANRPLGRDIDGRLSDSATRDQAVRDMQLALALGAQVSDTASGILPDVALPSTRLNAGAQLLLDMAARDNARAETVLRAAALLDEADPNASDRAQIVGALHRAGLRRFAGPLAAQGFLDAAPLSLRGTTPISNP